MRELLSLTLQALIVTGDAEMVTSMLTFARANTFLLALNTYWIQVALRVSEPDGPSSANFALLETLMKHETVYKGSYKESTEQPADGNGRATVNPYFRDKRRQT